jgi:heme/copper-type cytochrome/quinol oxidase subunit 2
MVKRKIPSPRRELNPRTPVGQPAAQRHTELSWLLMMMMMMMMMMIIIIIIII